MTQRQLVRLRALMALVLAPQQLVALRLVALRLVALRLVALRLRTQLVLK